MMKTNKVTICHKKDKGTQFAHRKPLFQNQLNYCIS